MDSHHPRCQLTDDIIVALLLRIGTIIIYFMTKDNLHHEN